MEQIGHHGLIAQQVLIPGFLSGLLLRLVRFLVILHIWLLTLAVKVLSHKVEYCVDALVRIVLAEACESGRVLSKDTLEELWGHIVLVHIPHLVDELGVGHYEASLSSKWVLLFKLRDELESTFEEEFGKFICVGKALQTRVHVTCVAEVLEAHDSILSVL